MKDFCMVEQHGKSHSEIRVIQNTPESIDLGKVYILWYSNYETNLCFRPNL